MEDTSALIARALGSPGDRAFVLRVEDELLRFAALRSALKTGLGDERGKEKGGGRGGEWWEENGELVRDWRRRARRGPWCCCSCCRCHVMEPPPVPGGAIEDIANANDGPSDAVDSQTQRQGPGDVLGAADVRAGTGTGGPQAILAFPKLSSYHRLLIHATAKRFGLRSASFPLWATNGGLKSVHCHVDQSGGSQRPKQQGNLGCEACEAATQVPLLLFRDLTPDGAAAHSLGRGGITEYCWGPATELLELPPIHTSLPPRSVNHSPAVAKNEEGTFLERAPLAPDGLAKGVERETGSQCDLQPAGSTPSGWLEGSISSSAEAGKPAANVELGGTSKAADDKPPMKRKGRGRFAYRGDWGQDGGGAQSPVPPREATHQNEGQLRTDSLGANPSRALNASADQSTGASAIRNETPCRSHGGTPGQSKGTLDGGATGRGSPGVGARRAWGSSGEEAGSDEDPFAIGDEEALQGTLFLPALHDFGDCVDSREHTTKTQNGPRGSARWGRRQGQPGQHRGGGRHVSESPSTVGEAELQNHPGSGGSCVAPGTGHLRVIEVDLNCPASSQGIKSLQSELLPRRGEVPTNRDRRSSAAAESINCGIARCLAAHLPGALCVRSIPGQGGSVQCFLALFSGAQEAEHASVEATGSTRTFTLCSPMQAHHGAPVPISYSPEGVLLKGRIQRVVAIEHAPLPVLEACGWEVTQAGHQSRTAPRIDVVAARRILS